MPRCGFPCLQQVSFTHDNANGLIINAFYPTQYVFDRAYGNFLGLCRLGAFMAAYIQLNVVRFNCFIATPQIGKPTKSVLLGLREKVEGLLPKDGLAEPATVATG